MWIYLILFLSLYCYLFLIRKIRANYLVKEILSISGLIPLSVLAALRDYSVGTDTWNYINMFNTYRGLTFTQAIERKADEFCWSIYTWGISKISYSPRFFLGITVFIMLLNIYIAVKMYDVNIRTEICVLIFLFFYFNPSLNLMRQCFAMSFLLISMVLFMNKKYLKSILVFVVSYYIHNSCMVGVIFLIFWVLLNRKWGARILRYIFLIVPILVFALPYIIQFINALGIIPARYVNLYLVTLQYDFSVGRLITYIFPIFLVLKYSKQLVNADKRNIVWILAFILETIVYQMRDSQDVVSRVVLTFSLANIFLFYSIYKLQYIEAVQNKQGIIIAKKRWGMHTLTLLYCGVYWLYYYVLLGNHHTVPYVLQL